MEYTAAAAAAAAVFRGIGECRTHPAIWTSRSRTCCFVFWCARYTGMCAPFYVSPMNFVGTRDGCCTYKHGYHVRTIDTPYTALCGTYDGGGPYAHSDRTVCARWTHRMGCSARWSTHTSCPVGSKPPLFSSYTVCVRVYVRLDSVVQCLLFVGCVY